MTEMSTVTYLEYELPGSFYPETTVRVVSDRDLGRDLVSAPSNAFAFSYYDVIVMLANVDGREVRTASAPLNRSKRYLIGAELVDQDAVRAMGPSKEILLSNMRRNRWSHVVRFHTGNFQPYDADRDVILSHG